MKVRMRIDIKGTAFGRNPRPPDQYSVKRGEIVECDERTALQMIIMGKAEEKLDGPLGRPYERPDKIHVLPKLAARVAALETPSPVDRLGQLLHERRRSGRAETPAECDLRRHAFNL